MHALRSRRPWLFLLLSFTGVYTDPLPGQAGQQGFVLAPESEGRAVFPGVPLAAAATPSGSLVVAVAGADSAWLLRPDGSRRAIHARGARGLGFTGDTLVIEHAQSLTLVPLSAPRSRRGVSFVLRSSLPGASSVQPVAKLADGSYLARTTFDASLAAQGRVDRLPLLRTSRNGTVLDTVAWEEPRLAMMEVPHGSITRGASYGPQPWQDSDLVARAPDGSWFAVVRRTAPTSQEPSRFSVVRLAPSGDTLGVRPIPFHPVPLTDSHVDRYLNRLETRGTFRGAFSRSDFHRAIHRHAFHPPVSDAHAGADGTLWLRREETGETVRWMVLGADGTTITEVEAPSLLRLLAVDAAGAWGVEPESPRRLVRYRIEARR